MEIGRIELIGGHPALDFVNTVEGRGSDAQVNYLSNFETLARWCARAELLSPAALEDALREARSSPQRSGRTWRGAMKLRDCLNRIFRAIAGATRPPEDAVAHFDKSFEAMLRRRRLAPTSAGDIHWSWRDDVPALELPVFEITLAAATLMTDGHTKRRIKVCANGPCDWLFLDTSRNGRRRWCRMAVCGNVSKVRRFRERQRTQV